MANFYHLFKTTCKIDRSAYFGIHGNNDPMWDENIDYVGRGPKLTQKIQQYGSHNFTTEVLLTSSNYAEVDRYIKQILTPATLADPLCLNANPVETSQKITDAVKDVPKSEMQKANMAIAKVNNENALGHVKTEEAKNAISETRKTAKLKWVHNPDTREELQMTAEEVESGDMLPGFKLGRLSTKLKKQGPVANTGRPYVDY